MWIKLCGVRDAATARLAADLGADAIGLNFYSRSPRCVDRETARQIVRMLPETTEAVGLFVNHPLDFVVGAANECGLRTIQLHGDEPPEFVARLNALVRRPPITDVVTRLEIGDIVLDILRREVTRAGRPVHLQPREFSLLEFLMRHAGRIVTRTMFLEEIWGFHFDPQTNIVESHLSRLRSKLREGFASDPIEMVRGAGYRMRADG